MARVELKWNAKEYSILAIGAEKGRKGTSDRKIENKQQDGRQNQTVNKPHTSVKGQSCFWNALGAERQPIYKWHSPLLWLCRFHVLHLNSCTKMPIST